MKEQSIADTLERRNMDLFKVIVESNEPLNLSELCDITGLEKSKIIQLLNDLIKEKKIKTVEAYQRKYYIPENEGMTCDEFNKAKTVIIEKLAYSKARYENLNEKIDDVDRKIGSFYTSIISILGVFVAVFSLIITNAKSVFDISQQGISMTKICIPIIISNFSTLIVIGALLFMIKIFIGKQR